MLIELLKKRTLKANIKNFKDKRGLEETGIVLSMSEGSEKVKFYNNILKKILPFFLGIIPLLNAFVFCLGDSFPDDTSMVNNCSFNADSSDNDNNSASLSPSFHGSRYFNNLNKINTDFNRNSFGSRSNLSSSFEGFNSLNEYNMDLNLNQNTNNNSLLERLNKEVVDVTPTGLEKKLYFSYGLLGGLISALVFFVFYNVSNSNIINDCSNQLDLKCVLYNKDIVKNFLIEDIKNVSTLCKLNKHIIITLSQNVCGGIVDESVLNKINNQSCVLVRTFSNKIILKNCKIINYDISYFAGSDFNKLLIYLKNKEN